MNKNSNWRTSDEWLIRKIDVIMIYSKYHSLEKLALYLGISRTAMYQRYKKPGLLRLSEIRKLELLAERSGVDFIYSSDEYERLRTAAR